MWTGYGILVYRNGIPRMLVDPDSCPTLQEAIRYAKVYGGSVERLEVDRWENGRIVASDVIVVGDSA